jgi:hypothetical protein
MAGFYLLRPTECEGAEDARSHPFCMRDWGFERKRELLMREHSALNGRNSCDVQQQKGANAMSAPWPRRAPTHRNSPGEVPFRKDQECASKALHTF